ncbi:MAG: hypothetical protein WCL71_04955 [Deltaproteobacteria bacterium]
MHTLTTRNCFIVGALFILISLVALVAIDRFGKNSRVIGSTGIIHAQNVYRKQVDSPKDAYRIWREAGYRGRTVVFIADRWESFDPGELIPAQMFRAYPLQLYNTAKRLEDDYLNGTTFLYVASMNKICRRIVAILPESEVDRIGKMASKSKDYRVSNKGVYVSRQGFPRWYMTGDKFAGVDEPALLYVGASYFKHAEPEELYRQLRAVGLQTDCVILCNEEGKDSVTPKEVAKLNKFAQLIGNYAAPLP